MEQEIKICQNCKKEFVIEPEDFSFYQKIKVPPPTWCPECRMVRRMMFRNERSLYKRKCDLCGKEIIAMYSVAPLFPVYCYDCWWSDKWDSLVYGKDYDFSKPFFEQFTELQKLVPRAGFERRNEINSPYTNIIINVKNSYMCFGSHNYEDCLYSSKSAFVKDCVDVDLSRNLENCYETLDSNRCYKLIFGQYCQECYDSFLLFDCKNCSHCLGCIGLRNKQYYIFNQPYSKENYFQKISEYWNGGFIKLHFLKEKFKKIQLHYPRKFAWIFNSVNTTGDSISNAKNCHFCFFVHNEVENCKYSYFLPDRAKDCWDGCNVGLNTEFCYETMSIPGGNNIKFSTTTWYSYDIQYSDTCRDSNNLFGCIGLRNKQYCILNKQYTKEEYEKLVPKIIEHMNETPYVDKKGRIYKYGEFFPPELSPFAYNETVAQEFFPLTKEEALEQGFSWKESEERNYQIEIKSEDLPDHIKDVKDDILGKVIECQHKGKCNEQCTTAFKIIPQELAFYQKMNLPLPRLCPNCRHYQRLKQRNPLKLWHRKCMCGGLTSTNGVYRNTIKHFHGDKPCPNEFETTYSPDRPEIVYCEECYLREVV